MRVRRPKNEDKSYRWQEIYNHWPKEAESLPEAVYYLMAQIIEEADLPPPKKYRGFIVNHIPDDQLYFFVDLFIAQYCRAMRKILKQNKSRDEARVEALRRRAMKEIAARNEEEHIRQIALDRENAGKKPPKPRYGDNFWPVVGVGEYDIDDEDDL